MPVKIQNMVWSPFGQVLGQFLFLQCSIWKTEQRNIDVMNAFPCVPYLHEYDNFSLFIIRKIGVDL